MVEKELGKFNGVGFAAINSDRIACELTLLDAFTAAFLATILRAVIKHISQCHAKCGICATPTAANACA